MDGSWWLAFGGIKLLIDPWLEGTEIDYAGWFNTQWHRTPPLAYSDLPSYDAVLITQKYPDHYHEETLTKLSPDIIFAPASLGKRLRRLLPDSEVHLFDKENREQSYRGVTLTHLPSGGALIPSTMDS